MLLLGIFVMHGFSWYLGILYRQHHNDFNWAYQHHVKMPRRQGFPMGPREAGGAARPAGSAARAVPRQSNQPGPHA
jgi:hypothetical protein